MYRLIVVFFLLAGESCFAAPVKFVHAQGKVLVDGSGKELYLRGINLGDWLVPEGYMWQLNDGPQSPREIEALVNELIGPSDAAEFWHKYRDGFITQQDIQFIRKSGFNSIRIPFHYKFFTAGNEEGFALLDRVIEWSRQAGLLVILDMHCAPGGQTGSNIDDSWGYPWLYESAQSQAEAETVWKRIAEHYRDNPTVIGYDLLNEPVPHYPQLAKYNSKLEPIYRRLAAAVRSVDKNHVLIFEGAQWASNFNIFGAPFDQNAVYSLHKYWMAPTQDAIKEYVAFRERYNVPIWLGESGENKDEWIAEFARLLEKNDIGWAFWPYKKMNQTSSPVSFDRPEHWDQIVEYAKLPRATGQSEKSIAVRPSIEDSQQAFRDLLERVRFDHCHGNAGYLKALFPPQQ